MELNKKKILIGITGSIAAYKIPFLVRLMIKKGAEVKIIITKDATKFVTAETLAVLSNNKVELDFFDNNHNWNNHVKLAMWADLFLIAPATANTISKMVNGACDNLLLATYLSARCKTVIAPAMDLDMYKHPATIRNLEQVKKDGVLIIPAEHGELASGLEGEGRMAEPDNIILFIEQNF
jgi:phosphopantothenoylcysteine decarboxylase/phosphopantothenate--cysteine ligase